MRFDFLDNKHEAQAFSFSLGVIVLSILAVVSFALTGGGVIFYVFALLAIALGFYMAYHISRAPVVARPAAAAPAPPAPAAETKQRRRRASKR